jgi:hypothetical protein
VTAFEARRGGGPLGTGVHLLRRRESATGAVADAWLTVLFLPVVPLGEWTLERADPGGAGAGTLTVTRVERPRPLKSLAWIVGGILAAVLALAPGYAAISLPLGSKILELLGIFVSLTAVVGGLGWLDQTRERVPFQAALRAARAAARSA